MEKYFTILLLALILTVAGCSSSGKLASPKETADVAFETGNYETALQGYETIIESYKNARQTDQCPVYGKAGMSAMKTGNKNKAIEYFEMDTYTAFVTADTYYHLAQLFREVDNLSREIMALSDYLEKFPDADKTDEVRIRIFEAYIISENWDLAIPIWNKIPNQKTTNIRLLEDWFTLNKAIDNEENCNDLANQLLTLDKENQKAMEWKAIQIFNGAEERYNREMKAYENNRTNRQYARLLDELEKSTQEFNVALGYFEKLYQNNPIPKYALYISNIYVRFNNKEKADYYRKKAGR